MKLVTKPTVEVIAASSFMGSETFEIPEDGDEHTQIGSFAAKVCYDSHGKEGRSNIANQTAVLESRHGSVFEHMTVSLYITGITRALSLELNRHRTFAISQRSTRYTAEEDQGFVLEPYYAHLYEKHFDESGELRLTGGIENFNTEELNLIGQHLANVEISMSAYAREVLWLSKINPHGLEGFELRKWARGKARNVLAHSLETRGVWTNNHRGWRWFLESRTDIHAEPEIRRLAYACYEQLSNVAPTYYKDYRISNRYLETPERYDYIPELVTSFNKV